MPGSRRRLRVSGGPDERLFLDRLARRRGRYERRLGMLLARLVGPADHCLDVGAHIGAVSLMLAAMSPRGQVSAFEPSAASAARLRANAAANGLVNLTVHHAAVLEAPGVAHLRATPFSAGSFVSRQGGQGVEAVPATSLDAWAAETAPERVDLIKVDVEGAELSVLAGAAQLIGRHRPHLVVECNPPALRRFADADPQELVAALAAHYRRVWWIGAAGSLVPLRRPADVVAHLRSRGVGDLLASERPIGRPSALAPAGVAKEWTERRLAMGLGPVPPLLQFAVDAGLRLEVLARPPARVGAGAALTIPVEVCNAGDGWLSSRFHTHPVRLGTRWRGPDGADLGEGPRTTLGRALGPGQRRRVELSAFAPGLPGRYELVVGAVQEGYAWLDELDPAGAVANVVEITD